jgi:hypothetical protein
MLAQWKRTLETCTTSREADVVMREVAQRFPDPKAPERVEANGWYSAAAARLRQGRPAKQAAAQSPQMRQREIPIDKPRERVLGEDDDQ